MISISGWRTSPPDDFLVVFSGIFFFYKQMTLKSYLLVFWPALLLYLISCAANIFAGVCLTIPAKCLELFYVKNPWAISFDTIPILLPPQWMINTWGGVPWSWRSSEIWSSSSSHFSPPLPDQYTVTLRDSRDKFEPIVD